MKPSWHLSSMPFVPFACFGRRDTRPNHASLSIRSLDMLTFDQLAFTMVDASSSTPAGYSVSRCSTRVGLLSAHFVS